MEIERTVVQKERERERFMALYVESFKIYDMVSSCFIGKGFIYGTISASQTCLIISKTLLEGFSHRIISISRSSLVAFLSFLLFSPSLSLSLSEKAEDLAAERTKSPRRGA